MESLLYSINAFVWGIPVLFLILTTGIVLSIRSRFAQIRFLPAALKYFAQSIRTDGNDKERSSGYRALCTALAATVGTGNIAGVAGAIAIGGPGVIFWMWICAILGMITKFAEVTLAVHFRHKSNEGEYIGGPMYMLENGLSAKFRCLAYVYSFFGIIAALGIGNAVQINTVIESVDAIATQAQFEFGTYHRAFLGVCAAVLTVFIFKKGAAGIGRITEYLVPFASVIYILLSVTVLSLRTHRIPNVLLDIFHGAFSPYAVTGGILGSAFITLRVGISRGVFTNEAGMGTASIAHACANVVHPAQQGLMGIMEVFLDTIVICTLTALVILSSGVPIPYGNDPGITLSMDAFAYVLGSWSKTVLSMLVCVFAFATILGWGLYGARCCQYLFGQESWNIFVYAQSLAVILGAILKSASVWSLAEIVNGLMAIPNLIGICSLIGVFIRLLKEFQRNISAYRC